MQILVYRQEGNLGPYSLEELRAQLAAGVVRPEDLAWHEGLSQWEPVPSLLGPSIPAAPLPVSAEQGNASAEGTRKKYLSNEANVRSVGILYYIGAGTCLLQGAFYLCALLILLISKPPPPPGHHAPSALVLLMALPLPIFFLALGSFLVWLAIQFRCLNRNAIIPGSVVASIGLIAIPIGTLINGYILYLIHCEKGKIVFSERYQNVIAATPHIQCKVSIIVKIAFGLLVAFIALCFFAVLIHVLTKH